MHSGEVVFCLFLLENIIQKLAAAIQIPLTVKTVSLQNGNQSKQSVQFGQIADTQTVQM